MPVNPIFCIFLDGVLVEEVLQSLIQIWLRLERYPSYSVGSRTLKWHAVGWLQRETSRKLIDQNELRREPRSWALYQHCIINGP